MSYAELLEILKIVLIKIKNEGKTIDETIENIDKAIIIVKEFENNRKVNNKINNPPI